MIHALQVLLVLTPSWESVQGEMVRLERGSVSEPFHTVGNPMPVVVGKKGMAWGLGLYPLPDDLPEERMKREGDRKAPAGVFSIGPIFYDSRFESHSFQIPYIAIDEEWEAVDDPASKYYNQLVSQVSEKDWNSSEKMLRDDEIYQLGLVLNHNANPIVAGAGSCIFMHVWRSSEKETWGCTALSKSDLKEVLNWARPGCVLVQLPSEEFALRNAELGLGPCLTSQF